MTAQLVGVRVAGYESAERWLRDSSRRWLVTGAAGFIGSHLVERLLALGQQVTGVDDFSTGSRENIAFLDRLRFPGRFRFAEGSIVAESVSRDACRDVDVVLHQAAIGSVPRSIADPKRSHVANVDGFVTLVLAAREAGVKRFVYASSSSVYGDSPVLPKVEREIGRPLSPYAATKRIDELYAQAVQATYGLPCVGLRYFNVFGPRQDPLGPYAAVVPLWIRRLLRGETCTIYGDGETSRDFCYVENAVQANILAALAELPRDESCVINVACGETTTLNALFAMLVSLLADRGVPVRADRPSYADFRAGDVRRSLADIGTARRLLGYEPAVTVREGLRRTIDAALGPAPARDGTERV